MRTRWWLLPIWICFLLRGWFYASMFPLWEGYDEFAHFGVIRAMASQGLLLPPRSQAGPRDVEELLKLAPVPWEVRGWNVFRSSLTDEDYWRLPAADRQQRESRLRNLPHEWQAHDSTAGISAYEALQPPLYYWLMAPIMWASQSCGLLAQAMMLRWIAIAIASLAIPFVFRVASAVMQSEAAALGCAALVAVMPGFATNAARVSNEPLSIVLFTLLVWVGLRILHKPANHRDAVLLGAILGLGLLTKAYFLTAVPAVVLLLIYKYRKAWTYSLTPCAIALAIAGWWYMRNIITTGTLSGLAESVTLRDHGAAGMFAAIFQIPWMRALDVILVSHLYFCGWSSLGVRSWMYYIFFAIIIVAAIGLIRQLRRPPVAWLAAVYIFFWLGQLYNVVLQYLTKGLAGSMGWYMYAVVACEVVLCAVAFGRFRVWAVALGTFLFGLLDLYGIGWLAIPYYTGIIAHKTNGALAAFHISAVRTIGFGEIFDRLAANKPALLSPPILLTLWILYLAGTFLPIVLICSRLSPNMLRLSAPARPY